ncbi:MAG: hypothetical protein K0R01_2014, partial [Mycobacterium sp.]|nr:hypothetical protein [Mycobacterium sp.]
LAVEGAEPSADLPNAALSLPQVHGPNVAATLDK